MIRNRWAGARGRPVLARRLVLAAAGAAALIPVLASCQAGNNAPTLQFHPPTDSATENVGTIAIRNVFVLGAPLGRDIPAGASASVFLALVNTGVSDTLVSISARGTAASVMLPADGIPVVAGHPVYYAGPFPRVVLRDLVRPLRSGTTVRLQLVFAKEGPVTMDVPVFPRSAEYATFAPPVIPASPAATARAGTTPSPGTSPTATRAATPSPSAS